ncbi:MAG: hypothetical protein LBJ00_04220 [Planctomycetaceae bacterium]|jgi:hypothetical protein|nr:hypothetical protein [Planctomycetaceae bacterium]
MLLMFRVNSTDGNKANYTGLGTHVTHDTEIMVVIQSIDRKSSRPVRDGM